MNKKSIKAWFRFSIIIFSFAFLTGCNSAKNADRSSCAVNEATAVIQPNGLVNYANVDPVLCANNELLAIIQPNGNVYTFDVCQRQTVQLTFDGQPRSGSAPDAGSYYFFDNSIPWSPDGSALLLGKDSVAYIINLQSGSQTTIGERVLFASWSPDGQHIAVAQYPTDKYEPWKVKHNAISVMDAQDFSIELFFEGTAPAWMSDSELIYFSIAEEKDAYTLNDVIKANLSGDHETLCPQVRTSYGPVLYALLSADKRYVAAQTAGLGRTLVVFSLNKSDTFSAKWDIRSGEGPTGWSPAGPVLAICTNGEGGKDGPLPQTSYGAVWLMGFHQFPKIFNDQRCLYWSRVSWHPSGKTVAFLNRDFKLVFIDALTEEFMDGPVQPSELKMYGGPWWSPSGHYIGVISDDNKVHVAQFNEDELLFEYVMDGIEMSWQPLKVQD